MVITKCENTNPTDLNKPNTMFKLRMNYICIELYVKLKGKT